MNPGQYAISLKPEMTMAETTNIDGVNDHSGTNKWRSKTQIIREVELVSNAIRDGYHAFRSAIERPGTS
jgi:hypothetical protein